MGDIGSRQVRFEVLPASAPIERAEPGAPREPVVAQRLLDDRRGTDRAEPARS